MKTTTQRGRATISALAGFTMVASHAHAAVELQGAEWFEYVRGGLLSVGPSFLLYPAGS